MHTFWLCFERSHADYASDGYRWQCSSCECLLPLRVSAVYIPAPFSSVFVPRRPLYSLSLSSSSSGPLPGFHESPK